MAFTFDGPNKLVILSTGTTYVSVKDMYSKWKEWTLLSDNAKYLSAMGSIGADPIPGGQLGSTFFMENGWKIRPFEGNQTLTIAGNLFTRDGSDAFVNTLGVWNVRIVSIVSTLVETVVQAGIGTPTDVANAVWDTPAASHNISGTTGNKLNLSGGGSGGSTASEIAQAVRANLTPELERMLKTMTMSEFLALK